MKNKIIFLNVLFCLSAFGQSITKNALFLGNSYTYVNDLPQMTANMAMSVGDVLTFDSNTPGGYTFQGHTTNSASISKIGSGNWDYVVLQEQSQLPSFPDAQVAQSVYPHATFLDNLINTQNPCAETVFYMTWGRKNGDASNCQTWPPVCTYEGMDNLLRQRYMTMTTTNNAVVSPVGAVWKYLRTNFPDIELYQSDESHPSEAGTYAAACSFYSIFFRKDPTLITFDASLSQSVANTIRQATKTVVYDDLINWKVGTYDPFASFLYSNSGNGVFAFSNTSQYSTSYLWDFGDGTTSIEANPSHTYSVPGTYTVSLIATKCSMQNTTFQTIEVSSLDLVQHDKERFRVSPNPSSGISNIVVEPQFIGLTYSIIDSNGKLLSSEKILKESNEINLSDFPTGIYWIKVGKIKELVKLIRK
jgi:hypothetical protein